MKPGVTLVVGDGPVARALERSLTAAGAAPLRWFRAAGGEPPEADCVLVAVRDEAIASVTVRVMAAQTHPPVLLHLAGALGADEPFRGLARRPAGVGLLHPLVSLAGAPDETLAGVAFAVEGDAAGRASALAIVELVGGVPLELPQGADRSRYHAAAALVANHSVGLVDASVELLASIGVPHDAALAALAALLGSTAKNLGVVGLPAALTGPIARGEVSVVERHLAALAGSPELAVLYRATARRVTKVAAEKGRADPNALARIRSLIDDGD